MCIRPEAGMCCIKYQPCADIGVTAYSLSAGDTALTTGLYDSQCTYDYIAIDGEHYLVDFNK